jgi:phosphomannomutase/phosphoglucomutase
MGQPSFWGRYDIRAVVGPNFNTTQYREVGEVYAQYVTKAHAASNKALWVAVGHDARLHTPELVAALIEGLTKSGINVVALGLSTSPIVYFSEHLHELNANFPDVVGTITVTASHNPSEYNGIKFTYQKRTLKEEEFQALKDAHALVAGQPSTAHPSVTGQVLHYNILPEYSAWFVEHFGQVGQGIKIVVDSGNATAGIAAPQVLRSLGCEVVDIYTEPDGRFPNHHPDPCVHKNLTDLIAKVRETGAQFGIAFDGDADRLGVVDEQGRVMPGDQITMFLSDAVLKDKPGSTIVFDVKSTQTLLDYVRERKGNPLYAPSGHAFMKRIMTEKNIPLGGELSGHIFFRDRHWGFDDALYAACRLVESFAQRSAEEPGYQLSLFAARLPQTIISEEIRVACDREAGRQLIQDLGPLLEREPNYFGSPVLSVETLDGFRANIENGFFLVRASGTEPCITLRFEAPSEAIYQSIERRIGELTNPLKSTAPALAVH